MEQRISIITLGVADLKQSKAFYDALGWRAVSDEKTPEIVAYDLYGMTLTLYPWEKLAEDAQIPPARSGPSAVTLAYNVSSEQAVEDALKEAENAGATIIKPAQKVFWGGYSGYFADPDSHLWEVAYNPFAPLGPEGQFQWNGVG